MLALAADQVWRRTGAVLNPHYRLMGLHGSE
jgi:putative two-component system hydrogenase maturation factor HypX/HoxX